TLLDNCCIFMGSMKPPFTPHGVGNLLHPGQRSRHPTSLIKRSSSRQKEWGVRSCEGLGGR
ncbi:hypothetical protein K443DRAFT_105902, partial [Laccaria amethystina LaAM-08-1]